MSSKSTKKVTTSTTSSSLQIQEKTSTSSRRRTPTRQLSPGASVASSGQETTTDKPSATSTPAMSSNQAFSGTGLSSTPISGTNANVDSEQFHQRRTTRITTARQSSPMIVVERSTTSTSSTSNIANNDMASSANRSPSSFSNDFDSMFGEMKNCNDRLAMYMDTVRFLKNENASLNHQLSTCKEEHHKEMSSVRSVYDVELEDVRSLIDELSKDKAKLQLEVQRLGTELDEIKADRDAKAKQCSMLESNVSALDSRINELIGKNATMLQDRKRMLEHIQTLENDKNRLNSEKASLRKKLEEETFTRVEYENTIQTLREKLAFKEQIHEKELNESRRKTQIEISELDGKLTQEYDEKLYQSLQDMREEYEVLIATRKDEISKIYEEKISSLETQLTRSNQAHLAVLKELKDLRDKFNDMAKKMLDLETEKALANQRTVSLENQIHVIKTEHSEEVHRLNEEITKERNEKAAALRALQDYTEGQINLNMEICAYGRLLDSEEARLNIRSRSGTSGERSFRKAKRRVPSKSQTQEKFQSNTVVNSTAKGDLEFTEVDANGKFVRLINKGDKDLSLSGFQIIRKIANQDDITYKFHRTVKIEPGRTVTVWSADVTEQAHEPPENIIMKGQKWLVHDSMATILVNSDGQEMATITHTKCQSSSSLSSVVDYELSDISDSEHFVQTPAPKRSRLNKERPKRQEKCWVM